MAQKIVIIGGLAIDHDRGSLLARLRAAAGDQYEWEWFKTTEAESWRVPQNFLGKFRWMMQQKPRPTAVLLWLSRGDTKNAVFGVAKEPVLVPEAIADGDQLVQWLLSAEAGLIPPREWNAGSRLTALICIFVKLIKNRSFNKDTHGHVWTQEADLLGQSPVNVAERPIVRAEAVTILNKLDGTILICKGGNQGKTKKEWCINTALLPLVKKVLIGRSLKPFEAIKALEPLLNYIEVEDGAKWPLHEIITERALDICRNKQRPGEPHQ
jgi:hypothetical protein